jgi:predicted DNA-binding protein YlxM (UPF0122 family)
MVTERNPKIIELYLSNVRIREIAEQFRISRQRIEQILKKAGVEKRRVQAKPKLTSEQRQQNRIERFWAKYDKTGECWLWTKKISPNGYGIVFWNKKNTHAHRVAFELYHNRKPKHLIKQTCKNRACGNPAHLIEYIPRNS